MTWTVCTTDQEPIATATCEPFVRKEENRTRHCNINHQGSSNVCPGNHCRGRKSLPNWRAVDSRLLMGGGFQTQFCLVVHQNKVHDVSEGHGHAGRAAGHDIAHATLVVQDKNCLHNDDKTGPVKNDARKHKQQKFQNAYRKLRTDLVDMGPFKPLKWYCVYKMTST